MEVLKAWKEHFQKLLNVINDDIANIPIYQTAEIATEKPTLEEVTKAIQRLKNNKAPGIDAIPAECLKLGGPVLYQKIHELIVLIWDSETLPESWKQSVIIPLHKKGSHQVCKNYRGISLINTAYKVLANVVLIRITPYAEESIGDYQCGFRPGRSTIDQIFTVRQILEKHWEFDKDLHQLFIDFQQAYDSVIRDHVWTAMAECGIPKKIIKITKVCVEGSRCCVKIGNKMSETFMVDSGLRQGDSLSPILFNIVLDAAIKRANIDVEVFSNSGPNLLLAFADDIDLVSKTTIKTKELFGKIEKETGRVGLRINEDKTKYMYNSRRQGRDRLGQNVTIDTYNFERVSEFKYLGTVITADNSMDKEMKARIQSGNRCYYALRELFQSRLLSRSSKLKLYHATIRPVVTYGCEAWTLTKANEEALRRFERKILRKIYGPTQDPISGQYRIRTNAELEQLYQGDIVREAKSHRLRWAGHVHRTPDDRMLKIAWQETPTGRRPPGRPRMRWRDNVLSDMRKMGIENDQEAMLDRSRWRQVVLAAKTHIGL